ncbi:6-pyruvoyl-tetrahydropterin synthase [Paraburkholderia sp. HC6.4b]|nr:6-pyruvoyl-tetrahydropterin synthase [Paraburkholderia sp. HC6.4b]MBB5453929.1 6-pyruvoyl-tetrahydropterin synthase [Paraburkholderia sp. Kb1A]
MTTRGVCDHEVTMMTSVMRGFLRDRKGARDEFLNIARQRVLIMLQAEHYHDISCGHRVYGNEGKCQNLHGHNYRIHFACEAASLDDLGRIIDFGSIKTLLCDWVENHWDHRMLLWRIARLMRLGRPRPNWMRHCSSMPTRYAVSFCWRRSLDRRRPSRSIKSFA